jgi:hypothetical protein
MDNTRPSSRQRSRRCEPQTSLCICWAKNSPSLICDKTPRRTTPRCLSLSTTIRPPWTLAATAASCLTETVRATPSVFPSHVSLLALRFRRQNISLLIRMTNVRPTSLPSLPPDPLASSSFVPETDGVDQYCGFCSSGGHCQCRAMSLQYQNLSQVVGNALPSSSSTTVRPTNSASASGPGSCQECQTNPQQRAWCQRVAQLGNAGSELLPSPMSRTPSIGGALESMEPPIGDASSLVPDKPSIGCSEAYTLLEGRVPMEPNNLEWTANLRPVSQGRRDTLVHPSRRYSALEIDTASIIATLVNTMQPIQPRASDGENADVVHTAQQYQTATQPPQDDSNDSLSVSPYTPGPPSEWQ